MGTSIRTAQSLSEALGAELVTNGSMEADANWGDYQLEAGDTNTQDNTKVHGGLWARKISVDAAGEGITGGGDRYTTATGKIYKFVAWVYPDDTTDINLTVRKGDNSGWVLDGYSFTGLNQDAWNECIYDYIEAAGGNNGYIILTSTGAGVWYFDDVSTKEVTRRGIPT